jgi:hypothetical protein
LNNIAILMKIFSSIGNPGGGEGLPHVLESLPVERWAGLTAIAYTVPKKMTKKIF